MPPTTRTRLPLPELIGLAAGAVALGAAQVVAVLVGAGSAPLPALADAAVDVMPDGLREAGIGWFGRHDKAVLLGIALVVALGLCALAGRWAVRSWRAGAALVVVLGALPAAAAATRPDASGTAPLPSLLGAAAGLLALRGLIVMLPAKRGGGPVESEVPDAAPDGTGRRSVLRAASITGAAGAVAAFAGLGVGRVRRSAERSREAVRLPPPSDAPSPAATGATPGDGLAVPGLSARVTSNADFYRIDTAFLVPRVTTQEWRLRIHGLVGRELTLRWDDLLARGLVEREITMACVSNPVGGDLVGTARWRGVPLAPLLAEAAPKAGADMVLSTSKDGWTCSTPLADLLDGRDAMLAVGMNGEPLPLEHGFPVRMVVPGLYGFVSGTKWVVDLEVTRFDRAKAYWTTRGWSDRGPIKTSSRIDVPTENAEVAAGDVVVAGVAWAPHRGVSAVEVQVDDGPWRGARLGADAGPDVWRQWQVTWAATPGDHRVRVRATDGQGRVQTGDKAGAVPDGATGWHEVRVVVR